MVRLRHQLPAYSPIPGRALVRALSRSARAEATAALQAVLADRYGAKRAVLCGSGTQALQLALSAVEGDVALPAFTCYDVASAAIGAGVRVRLYDVDPATLSPDAASLEAALREGARAVVVAPLYGVPIRWAEVESLAAAHGALVIEDAAQGSGASWRGVPLGGLGAVSVISFGRGKGWTGGSGGALLLRDGSAAGSTALARGGSGARTLLAAAAQWAIGRPAIYGIPVALPGLGLGETRYHAPAPPAALAEAVAALALATLAASDAEAAVRRENARALLDALDGAPSASTIRIPSGAVAGYIRLPVRLPGGLASLPLEQRALRLGAGRSYPTTLAELPELQASLTGGRQQPGARELVNGLLTLPTHSLVRGAERDELVRLVAATVAAPGSRSTAPLRR